MLNANCLLNEPFSVLCLRINIWLMSWSCQSACVCSPFNRCPKWLDTKCGMKVTLRVGLLLFFPTIISNIVMEWLARIVSWWSWVQISVFCAHRFGWFPHFRTYAGIIPWIGLLPLPFTSFAFRKSVVSPSFDSVLF